MSELNPEEHQANITPQEQSRIYEEMLKEMRFVRRMGNFALAGFTTLATINYAVAHEAMTSPYVLGGFAGGIAIKGATMALNHFGNKRIIDPIIEGYTKRFQEEG